MNCHGYIRLVRSKERGIVSGIFDSTEVKNGHPYHYGITVSILVIKGKLLYSDELLPDTGRFTYTATYVLLCTTKTNFFISICQIEKKGGECIIN